MADVLKSLSSWKLNFKWNMSYIFGKLFGFTLRISKRNLHMCQIVGIFCEEDLYSKIVCTIYFWQNMSCYTFLEYVIHFQNIFTIFNGLETWSRKTKNTDFCFAVVCHKKYYVKFVDKLGNLYIFLSLAFQQHIICKTPSTA